MTNDRFIGYGKHNNTEVIIHCMKDHLDSTNKVKELLGTKAPNEVRKILQRMDEQQLDSFANEFYKVYFKEASVGKKRRCMPLYANKKAKSYLTKEEALIDVVNYTIKKWYSVVMNHSKIHSTLCDFSYNNYGGIEYRMKHLSLFRKDGRLYQIAKCHTAGDKRVITMSSAVFFELERHNPAFLVITIGDTFDDFFGTKNIQIAIRIIDFCDNLHDEGKGHLIEIVKLGKERLRKAVEILNNKTIRRKGKYCIVNNRMFDENGKVIYEVKE